jgi:hypothetical protein
VQHKIALCEKSKDTYGQTAQQRRAQKTPQGIHQTQKSGDQGQKALAEKGVLICVLQLKGHPFRVAFLILPLETNPALSPDDS